MNVLVTGSTGSVGRIITKHLRESSDVTNVFGLSRSGEDNSIPLDLSRITDKEVTQLLQQYSIDTIVHCAATLRIQSEDDYKFNIHGLDPFLNNELGKAKNYITFGSAAEIGITSEPKLTEDIKPNPSSPYGKSKLEQTLHLQKYFDQGVKIALLRLFNPLAPNLGPSSFLMNLINSIKKGADGVLNINNYDIERDFVDLRDVARLVEMMIVNTPQDFLYNVGSGKNTSYKEFLEICFSLLKQSNLLLPEIKLLNGSEPYNKGICDISKALAEFNWKPQYTLEDTIKWCLDENKVIKSKLL